MCVEAPHMMSMVSTSSHMHARRAMRHMRRGCPMHMHARHACSVRTSTLHVGGCMFLAEPAMFLLTCGVFAAAANVFALCLLGERMFLLVFGAKFNEEVCLRFVSA